MRNDDIAFQRGTRVAGFGLLLQVALGLTLLIFGILAPDDSFQIAAGYVLVGSLAWLSLVVVFNQHKLERIESLEADELQQQRMAGLGSAFDSEAGEFNVAARRLGLMHKWMMPIVSWIIILLLVGLGLWNLLYMNVVTDPQRVEALADRNIEFSIADEATRGWALAICLGAAAVCFITSRFVSGMSKQPVWQNLRGGAGYMVGNALVLLAVATGIIFTYFDNLVVMEWVARVICYFMFLIAAETFLNFLLNLYRPRRPGEVPRPAFDSRLLSLLSAPDSIVRSINEAVNYQFGFDITSSWGYRLLIRAVRRLAIFAVLVLVALNSLVIVEPQEQGVVLRGGEIVRWDGPGLMLKWPWPIESAEVYNVTRTRLLPLTARLPERREARNDPIVWTNEIDANLGIEPFIVAAQRTIQSTSSFAPEAESLEDALAETDEQDQALESVRKNFALIESEFLLHYRLKEDFEEGLKKFIQFSNEVFARRQRMDMRSRTLKAIALREVTQYLTERDINEVIASERSQITLDLETRIQQAFDAYETGVEVLNISNPWIRPAGTAAPKYEELAFNIADREQARANAERDRLRQLIGAAGSADAAERIIALIDERNELIDNNAPPEELEAIDVQLESMMLAAGGEGAKRISEARTDQWQTIIGAQARLEEFRGRLQAYRAGPSIYREFLLMDALTILLADAQKYFIAVDEGKMNIDIEMLKDDESFVFEEGVAEGETVERGVGQ